MYMGEGDHFVHCSRLQQLPPSASTFFHFQSAGMGGGGASLCTEPLIFQMCQGIVSFWKSITQPTGTPTQGTPWAMHNTAGLPPCPMHKAAPLPLPCAQGG